jgi:crotonobetainyl-CoA:carnitine CoA-transferase CaiB-like acyl-CoA transferase
MTTENIFSGLKVVDLSSFIAGPSAAVILSDFGANVIKVEPPAGDTWRIAHKVPPQPRVHDNYPWHLNNRNKRGLSLDFEISAANGIVVPLEGAGTNLKLTVSSPMQIHDVVKVPARRAPEIGEHNEEILKELGFNANEIEDLGVGGALGMPIEQRKAS